MGTFDLRRTVTQENFIFGADNLLAQAGDYGVSTQRTVDGAQEILVTLDSIEKGDLVVQPPLDEEQIKRYSQAAHNIVTFGEKALIGIDDSRRGRKRLSELVTASAVARMERGPVFRGQGSSVKS